MSGLTSHLLGDVVRRLEPWRLVTNKIEQICSMGHDVMLCEMEGYIIYIIGCIACGPEQSAPRGLFFPLLFPVWPALAARDLIGTGLV